VRLRGTCGERFFDCRSVVVGLCVGRESVGALRVAERSVGLGDSFRAGGWVTYSLR